MPEQELHEPTHEEIAATAYRRWESHGKREGTAHEDWQAAETYLWLIYEDKRAHPPSDSELIG
jgi:hypothetical protein